MSNPEVFDRLPAAHTPTVFEAQAKVTTEPEGDEFVIEGWSTSCSCGWSAEIVGPTEGDGRAMFGMHILDIYMPAEWKGETGTAEVSG